MSLLPQLASGARGLLLANGVPIATVTNVSVNITDSVRVPHTFGSYSGRSSEPLSTSCSVSIGTVIPVNDINGKAVNSSAIALGLQPTINKMATSEDITIELQDKITGVTLACIRNCRFSNRTLSISAQSLGNANWSLVGIYDSSSNNSADQLGF